MAIFPDLGENTQVWSSCLKKRETCSVRSLAPPRGGNFIVLTFAAGLLCCLLTLGAAWAQETQPESQSIRGTVINSVTQEPLGRALVYSSDNRFATLTDSEGHFEFAVPAPSPEMIEGTPATGSIRIEAARSISLMARKPGFLNPADSRASLRREGKDQTIALVPEAIIVGHVVLPSSEAPDRIQVELYRRQVQEGRAHWVMREQVTTKSTGEFRFADLSAGSYKLLTRELLDLDPQTFNARGPQFGYPPVYFPAAGDFVSAETIALTAGTIFQAEFTLVKQPYYPVKVAVANAQLPLGMRVVVSPQGHRGPGYSLGAGQGTIDGLLPNGTYTVEAASFGPNSAAGSVSITVKGAGTEGASLALVPDSSINVNVKEEFTNLDSVTGQGVGVVTFSGPTRGPAITIRSGPRLYLNVRLEPADDVELGQASFMRPPTRSDDQSLAIDKVQPGRYWVKVNSSRGFASSVTSGGVDLQHEPIVVSGGSSPPIEITMRDDWAEVDGTVEGIASPFGETNSPPFQDFASFGAAAHVYFVPLPDSNGEFRETWVGRDGKFNLQQLPPGAYRVLAFEHEQPELEYHNAEAMRTFDSKGLAVRLVGNQKEQLRLQLISTSQ